MMLGVWLIKQLATTGNSSGSGNSGCNSALGKSDIHSHRATIDRAFPGNLFAAAQQHLNLSEVVNIYYYSQWKRKAEEMQHKDDAA